MTDDGPPPSERIPNIYNFVENRIFQILADYDVWPANIFKLECEKYGIYQDATGGILKELLNNDDIGKDKLKTGGSFHPVFTELGKDASDMDAAIEDGIKILDDFQSNRAYFAELTAYVVFCKVHDIVGGAIGGFDVLPKGPRPHILHSSEGTPDGLVALPGEYVPVEVYNGRDYLGPNGEKHGQMEDFSSDDGIPTNPLLINRRSDQRIKEIVRGLNGMVVDTGLMMGCIDTNPDLPDILELLNISELFELLPEIETEDGNKLNGADYHRIALNSEQGDKLRPTSKIASAANALPEQYIKRVRGGLQLQYVNSFYRRVNGRTEREASLVLQNIYNLLLRGGGKDRSILLDEGWGNMIAQYRRVKSAKDRKDSILDQTGTYLTQLINEKIINRRDGGLHARGATHPQQSLSF